MAHSQFQVVLFYMSILNIYIHIMLCLHAHTHTHKLAHFPLCIVNNESTGCLCVCLYFCRELFAENQLISRKYVPSTIKDFLIKSDLLPHFTKLNSFQLDWKKKRRSIEILECQEDMGPPELKRHKTL